MSTAPARIDDPTQDTPSDNLDAVQVQAEIQRLATAPHPDDDNDSEGDDDDSYLEQYELDSDEEDELLQEEMGVEDLNIEDEDWEIADGDFTKLYNRMRQHQKVLSTLPTTRNGTQGIKGEADTEADMPLPARNARRGGVVQGEEDVGKGLTARQRRAVLRRLNGGEEVDGEAVAVASSSTSTVPKPPAQNMKKKPLLPVSLGGVPSAPKHSSLSANQKDKADRATVDQVLDSRTRAVLQSLIRRGLVSRIEGCVSTGKEANVYFAPGPKEEPVELSESKTYPRPYPANLALKIYKTSILSFKSRSQYIQGEHRFRNAYTKVANPRKMVKVWAEKELRNLRRLREGGVRCPRVVDVRENVLVMEFLGSEAPPTLPHISGLALPSSSTTAPSSSSSKPSPSEPTERSPAGQEESESSRASKRLKDADIDTDELRELYAELLVAMRWMFRRCRLVHTDLSEYNILYHDNHLYIIDVSQSVEHDHPSSFDFLRHDIKNIDEFFVRRSGGEIKTLGIRGTFDFVVSDSLKRADGTGRIEEKEETEDDLKEIVGDWLDSGIGLKEDKTDVISSMNPETGDSSSIGEEQGKRATDEAVFMSSYIPRNLGEVYDPERDIDKIAAGKGDELIYASLTGVNGAGQSREEEAGRTKSALKGEKSGGEAEQRRGVKWEDELNEDEEESEEEEDDDDEDGKEKKSRGFRHEDKDAKKERKKALKEEKREKRQTKMPKAEKARRIKQTAHSK